MLNYGLRPIHDLAMDSLLTCSEANFTASPFSDSEGLLMPGGNVSSASEEVGSRALMVMFCVKQQNFLASNLWPCWTLREVGSPALRVRPVPEHLLGVMIFFSRGWRERRVRITQSPGR